MVNSTLQPSLKKGTGAGQLIHPTPGPSALTHTFLLHTWPCFAWVQVDLASVLYSPIVSVAQLKVSQM